jgi:hypothetical protein
MLRLAVVALAIAGTVLVPDRATQVLLCITLVVVALTPRGKEP